MIYLISDLHGDKKFKGLQEYLRAAESNDLLIILGDIGLNFENTPENRDFTEYFLSMKKNIAFIDGNHENFGYINSFPLDTWNGGTVHRLSEHIVHMKRGNIYEIDGKSFFAFGGCKSSPKWAEMGLWYPGEEATEEECRYAYENLKAHDFKVDYVLTHKYEKEPVGPKTCINLKKLTEFIEGNVAYRKWYSGHWHRTEKVDEKHELVYDILMPVGQDR